MANRSRFVAKSCFLQETRLVQFAQTLTIRFVLGIPAAGIQFGFWACPVPGPCIPEACGPIDIGGLKFPEHPDVASPESQTRGEKGGKGKASRKKERQADESRML